MVTIAGIRNQIPIGASNKPVLLFVHGGAYVGGDKHLAGSPFYSNIGAWAARNGMVGVNTQWQKRHELRENKLAVVHGGPLRADAKDHKSWNRSSNRDQTKIVKNQGKSLTYEDLM